MRTLPFFAALAFFALPVSAMAQDLPPGPGADVTVRVCGSCHGMDQVIGERHDAAGWTGVVNDMINNGASASDDEAKQIVNYLTTNFGVAPAPAAAGAAPAAPAAPADAAAAPAAPAPAAPATPPPAP